MASFAALHAAAQRAIAGKRKKPGAAAFMANLEPNLLALERELKDQSYRTGKGTHRALERHEHYRDRYRHVLRADIYRYFPSIDHPVLKADLRRRIACPQTLWLMDAIIDGSNPQEEVLLHFAGDDLFTPLERRRGLPLGNLTSQFFANVYLDGLDHFCKEVLRAPYVRYVDDFALFSNDAGQLRAWQARIADYLAQRRLALHPHKTQVQPCAEPAQFLGFVTAPGGRRRLPDANVTRFANRLRVLRKRWQAGEVEPLEVRQRIGAWVAHACHANTVQLRHTLFSGGWFDPYWANGTPAKACMP